MTYRRFPLLGAIALAAVSLQSSTGAVPLEAETGIPPTAQRAYGAIASRFDRRSALDVVTYMNQYWRLAGNPGFNASLDHIRDGLEAAGFSPTAASQGGTLRIEEFPNSGRGWDYRVGTIEFDGAAEPPLLSREQDRVSLAIHSFSTPPEGLRAPLVDVAGGAESDFTGKDVKGAVVLGDASLGRLWQDAVKRRGAAGVISTEVARYIRPADPAAMSAEQQEVLQWDSIPYDADLKSFGFKASWRAARRIRDRLNQGPVGVRVRIETSFYAGPNRTLVAEIRGRSAAAERIVMVAHVQEPGANDDASGCATLYEIARAMLAAIRSGALPQPERTLTFLWVDEVRGSRQWMTSHPDDARGVQYMFAMDMTGEDTSKTGGTFLIEKQADPSAVWPRPSDPHTEWGASEVRADSLKGSLLNDLHYAVCMRRARDTGWVVRTNPYEGGSDHTAFASSGVPSLLNWHFTDRFYHTNQDTLDKVSADEMRNVGIAVGTSAWLLASATSRDAFAVVDLLAASAARRLALERAQGAALVARSANPRDAEVVERRVIDAWIRWYGEALDSALRLPPAGATGSLREHVAAAKRKLN